MLSKCFSPICFYFQIMWLLDKLTPHVPTLGPHIISLLDHTALEPELFTILLYPPKERVYTIHINGKVWSSFTARWMFCLSVRKPRHKIVKTQSQTLTLKQSSKPTENKRLHTLPSALLAWPAFPPGLKPQSSRSLMIVWGLTSNQKPNMAFACVCALALCTLVLCVERRIQQGGGACQFVWLFTGGHGLVFIRSVLQLFNHNPWVSILKKKV